MGTVTTDYNFKYAVKPCDDSGKCIENAESQCNWYPMCDLSIKMPWKKPTQPQEFTRPRKQAYIKVHLSRSQFFEKQRKIKKEQ